MTSQKRVYEGGYVARVFCYLELAMGYLCASVQNEGRKKRNWSQAPYLSHPLPFHSRVDKSHFSRLARFDWKMSFILQQMIRLVNLIKGKAPVLRLQLTSYYSLYAFIFN